VTRHLEEYEEKITQPGLAKQQATLASGTPKSKKKWAICLIATLALGAFFALRSGEHMGGTQPTGEANNSVIIHAGAAYQGDIGVYVDNSAPTL
jgi:hypothetical protein